jgi:hypothetical protein
MRMTDAPTVPRPAMPTRRGRVTNNSSLKMSGCFYDRQGVLSMRTRNPDVAPFLSGEVSPGEP